MNNDFFKKFYEQFNANHQNKDKTSEKKDPEDLIQNYNKEIREKDANQKFEFRDKLLKLVSKLIWVQLVFFNVIIVIVILSVIFKFSFLNNNVSGVILNFLKYYISVTIVELLGMLLFVMRYVFDRQN